MFYKENTVIKLHNKYVKIKLMYLGCDGLSIVEIFSDDFALNKYILNRKNEAFDEEKNKYNKC